MRVFPGEPYLYIGRSLDAFTLVNVYSQCEVRLPYNTTVKFGVDGGPTSEIRASSVLSTIDKDNGMYIVFGEPRCKGLRTSISVTVREPVDYSVHAIRNIIE